MIRLFALLALMLASSACTPNRIIYQHADLLGGQHDLYVVREDGSNRAVLANSPDEETACGVTTDRRIVFTRQTANGGDIYVVNENGTGLAPVRTTSADEACFGVTGNNMVIFGVTVSVVNHDLYSISVNAAPRTPLSHSPRLRAMNSRWRLVGTIGLCTRTGCRRGD